MPLKVKEDIVMDLKLKALKEESRIAANKQFKSLAKKTQVLTPYNGMNEVANTRLTHSREVANSSLQVAINIAIYLDVPINHIDHQYRVHNVSLLHDIGHPPFGHDGAKYISDFFENLGIKEDFSDNNNNLVVIEKNKIIVSDYTLASTIKYPDKLYDNQKVHYQKILDEALALDMIQLGSIGIYLNDQKTTIACQMMDEADRNTYVCSDLSDFICLGNTLYINEIVKLERYNTLTIKFQRESIKMINVIKSKNKSDITVYFNTIKDLFNANYTITDDGLTVLDNDLLNYREFLSDIECEFFIKPIQKSDFNKQNIAMLKFFINYVIKNKFYPSKTYKKLIENSTNEQEKLTHIRNMVSEVTDCYVFNFQSDKNQNKKELQLI
jgi:dGTP triphosphohydrolase